jgi:hypothetical protein
VDVGGTGNIKNATNLNPVKPGSGGQETGIPNHVKGSMEEMDTFFEPGSVKTMYSQRLRYGDVDWPKATQAAAKVMPPGGKVSMIGRSGAANALLHCGDGSLRDQPEGPRVPAGRRSPRGAGAREPASASALSARAPTTPSISPSLETSGSSSS